MHSHYQKLKKAAEKDRILSKETVAPKGEPNILS
jgi:hypothetical protein